jgi:hypothetical protein
MADGFDGGPHFVDESPKESAEEIVWRRKGPAFQKEAERLAKENARLRALNRHAKDEAEPNGAAIGDLPPEPAVGIKDKQIPVIRIEGGNRHIAADQGIAALVPVKFRFTNAIGKFSGSRL